MTNSQNLPLLIFDLDGTLIDSAPDIHVAINQMLKKYRKNSVDLETLTSHIGDGLHKLVNDFFPEFEINSKENIDRVDEFLDIYKDQHLTNLTVLYPGVYEFLNAYEGPKALVTNKNIKPTLEIFEFFNLNKLKWVDIIGGDSLSEKKPSPLPLHTVMRKIKIDPKNTWMIGDGRPDMLSAQAAGCNKAAVHYGYSKAHELAQFNPDRVLNNFSDIKSLFV